MRTTPLRAPPATAPVNGMEIVYDTVGDPSHQPLLLIAGLGNQMIDWRDDLCRQLAERGFWVIRFDNRDAGMSTRFDHAPSPGFLSTGSAFFFGTPSFAPYTLHDMVKDAVGLLDHLGVTSAHVVGGSLGGMIAQEMAVRYPQRTRTLTSCMSTTGYPRLPLPKPRTWIIFRPAPKNRTDFVARALKVRRALKGPRYLLDQEEIRAHANRLYDRCPRPAGTARQLAAIAASGSRDKELGSLAIPTLVIHGDADPLIPVAHGIHTSQVIPNARLSIIEGVGHECPRPAWDQVVDAITNNATEFFSRTSGVG